MPKPREIRFANLQRYLEDNKWEFRSFDKKFIKAFKMFDKKIELLMPTDETLSDYNHKIKVFSQVPYLIITRYYYVICYILWF